MRKLIRSAFLAMLSVACFTLPVMGEGIASMQWLSPENVQTLPRHKITISSTPDPKDPDLLNVRMTFKLEPGHKLYGVSFSIGGPNTAKPEQGDRFSSQLSVDGDTCSFTVSKKSLAKIELGYRVNENSYSMHFFSIMGTELPKLASVSNPPEGHATTKTPNPAEHAAPSDCDKSSK